MTDFFISDTHFGHQKIIKYCNRPFGNVEDMDCAMIAAWNAVVRTEDTVWHLGDFSLSSSRNKIDFLLDSLHGTKHLIRGNHDHVKGVNGWTSVQEMAEIECEGQRLFLCHYPMRDWPGKWHGAIHLYGHVHGNLEPLAGSMDVGVDTWGGKPVTLDEILLATRKFYKTQIQCNSPFVIKEWKITEISKGLITH